MLTFYHIKTSSETCSISLLTVEAVNSVATFNRCLISSISNFLGSCDERFTVYKRKSKTYIWMYGM